MTLADPGSIGYDVVRYCDLQPGEADAPLPVFELESMLSQAKR